MGRFALGEKDSIGDAHQFVAKMHHRLANISQGSSYDHFIVVTCRRLVAAARVHHRDAASIIGLHVAIREPQLAQKFHPAHFKPHKMIGVVYDSHLVRFRVSHPHPGLRNCVTVIVPVAHFPLRPLSAIYVSPQRGLRFSRNAEIPSRKSSVVRMAAFSRTAALICSSSSACAYRLRSRLVARSDVGLFSISCPASSFARSMSLFANTISLINPIRCASSAPNSLPVSSRSRACF